MEPLAALTPEECAIFKRDGVLIKRGVLDPDLCRRAIDLLWQHNADHHPSTHLVRDDPSTHVGPFPDQDTIDVSSFGEGAGGQIRRGYGWDVRELGSHTLLLELIPRRLWPWAEQLVGAGTLATPDPSAEFIDPYWQGEMTRGFYCLLPSPPGEERLPLAEQVGGAHGKRTAPFASSPGACLREEAAAPSRHPPGALHRDLPAGRRGSGRRGDPALPRQLQALPGRQ